MRLFRRRARRRFRPVPLTSQGWLLVVVVLAAIGATLAFGLAAVNM